MGMTMKIDLADLDDLIEAEKLHIEQAARPAAQAGAQVLYDRVKANVDKIGRVSGNLESAIYQVYSKTKSIDGRAVYHVSWNAKKAPHGHLLENGYWQRYVVFRGKDGKWHTDKTQKLDKPRFVPGRAFVREALSQSQAAADAVRDRFLAEVEKHDG